MRLEPAFSGVEGLRGLRYSVVDHRWVNVGLCIILPKESHIGCLSVVVVWHPQRDER